MSTESIFSLQDDRFVPSAYARGPWDPGALHGGAVAALIVQELERQFPSEGMQTGRLSFQLLRPVPAKPLTLTTAIVRKGRRVQELGAELFDEDTLVCRAKALRVQPVYPEIPARGGEIPARGGEIPARPGGNGDEPATADAMPGPEDGEAVRFALDDPSRPSFATAMDMRWLTEPFALGPGRVWMRMRLPLLPDRPAGPLALLAAVCDFGNGVSSELRFDQYLFINADLTLHLQRAPRGEWAGIDARMLLAPQGAGLAESVAYDAHGAVGRAFQTLVVEPRG